MKLIYIAGPYRAPTGWGVENNIRAAEAVGHCLMLQVPGVAAVIPHTMYKHMDGSLPDQHWIDATLELMRRCDGVLLWGDWQKSIGTVGEKTEAERLGLPVFTLYSEVSEWLFSRGG